MNWLEDELASTSTDSFLAILKGDPKVDLEKNALNSERVQMVWDSKGTGVADSSKIFAEGFNDPISGIASGVLARKGNVYLTSIPDLWLLQDNRRTGSADSRTSLAKGFGIRTAFLGHDLHGLRIGPDGFGIGEHGLERRMHLRQRLGQITLQGTLGLAQQPVHHGATLGAVDVLTTEHGVALFF
jgi:quinoprotein glucose dehydrogenase